MNGQQKFFLIYGIIVVVGLFFFIVSAHRRRRQSYFRDDIWDTSLKGKEMPKDLIDQNILLGYRPDPQHITHEDTPKAGARFQPPRFAGKPHEILGIPQNSPKEEINAAFRHWMKRYHPDRVAHLGQSYIEQAKKRAEQLNTAREALLKSAR